MTAQKIEFEYSARNEQASSRAWQAGTAEIDRYNKELAETNAKTRQAAEAMSAFGNKGKDAFAGMDERQRRLASGLERLRSINQSAQRDAHSYRMAVAARSQLEFNHSAMAHAAGFSATASRASRNAANLEFSEHLPSAADLAGLGQGDRERRLTTNSIYRGKASGRRGSLTGGMGMMGQMLGGAAVAGTISQVADANNRFLENADTAAEAYDTLARSLNVQAGLSGSAAREASARIKKIAFDAAADKNFAFATSTQLVSSGFSAGQATGDALREMLTGINAMPAPGGQQVDPVALAEAATSYMTSQNMDKTGENLKAVLAGVQQLYKSTNFQLADFTELSGQADTMRGKMTMGEQFGAFSVLRDVGKSAEEATTALRNIAIRSQTAAGQASATNALGELGLTPEDIDMVGESFQTVLDRLAKATEGVDPAKVTTALEKVFGERTLAGLLRLIEDRDKVSERSKAIGDPAEYEANAKEMSTGVAAAKRRQQMEQETFAQQHSQKDAMMKQELSQMARERGVSEARIAVAEKQYDMIRGTGRAREMAGAAAYGDFGIGVGGLDRVSEAKRRLSEKGVNLDPTATMANPANFGKPLTARAWDAVFGGGEPDFIEAPLGQDETSEEALARRRQFMLTPDQADKVQPNRKSLPRPGAKTSAPPVEIAGGGAVELKNSTLERGATQQVALLSEIADGISILNDRLRAPSGGVSQPSAPWDTRRPPPLPPIVSLSASEVS